MNMITTPIVIDLDTASEADVDQIRRGRGRIVDDVREVMVKIQSTGGPKPAGRVFVPVVVVYSEPQSEDDDDGFEIWHEGIDRTGE